MILINRVLSQMRLMQRKRHQNQIM